MFVGNVVVVGIGWYIVHRLSIDRDLSKARLEMLADAADDLDKRANEVLLSAQAYHTSPRDVQLEAQIKMALQDMAMRAIKLSDVADGATAPCADCRSKIAALRRAATGRHFEDEHTGEIGRGDVILQDVAEATLQVKRAALSLKYRAVRPS
jgi:hypothetical protein